MKHKIAYSKLLNLRFLKSKLITEKSPIIFKSWKLEWRVLTKMFGNFLKVWKEE